MPTGYLFQYLLIPPLAAILPLLPFSVSIRIAEFFGGLGYLFLKKRRQTALSNLDRAFGSSLSLSEKQRIARASFRHSAVSMLELFLIPKIVGGSPHRGLSPFTFRGEELFQEAFKKGRGVILAIAHLGAWEYLEFLAMHTSSKWSVIVKTTKNPYVDRKINVLRKMTTVTPVPKKNATKTVLQELRQNHGVALLIDQWAGPEGIWTDFFGHPTSTTSIPARLAKRTGAEILMAYCLRKAPGKYEICIFRPDGLDFESDLWEKEITQRLNHELEALIRKYPGQWLWMHRRWKPKPEALRLEAL